MVGIVVVGKQTQEKEHQARTAEYYAKQGVKYSQGHLPERRPLLLDKQQKPQ